MCRREIRVRALARAEGEANESERREVFINIQELTEGR